MPVPSGSTGGTGSYTWPISTTQTPGNDYTIRITSTTNPTYTDVSNSPFSIVTEPPLASITVTSPNGGENWQQGSSPLIQWSYTGDVGSTVRIELLKPGVLNQVINASTSAGTGGYRVLHLANIDHPDDRKRLHHPDHQHDNSDMY